MKEKQKIGFLVLATNKYTRFIPDLIKGADEFFLRNYEVEYFIFTDDKTLDVDTERKVHIINTEHKPWPYMPMAQYGIFYSNKQSFEGMDYLYYCDADMRFCDHVGPEILSDRVATQHPGLYGRRGTPETNPNSTAYVFMFENMQYFAGGFNGGSHDEYIKMCKTCYENIEKDFENDITAVWHDESHMNRYFIDNPPTKILDPGYCYGESLRPPFKPRLIALDKDHKEIRS
jgi:histo-blood group ABO system transferase